jgi:ribosomal protein S18 acetylase RimI-like enzyme
MDNTELGKMNANVLIRDLRKSDLSDLLGLFPMCFAEEFEISGFDPDHLTDMVNRAFGRTGSLILGLLRLFGKEPVKLLVAEADGKIVGTTIINNRGRSGYISSVMVHPDYRRKGIATRLMTNALNYIRRGKKARAVLHVDSTNASAKASTSSWGSKHLSIWHISWGRQIPRMRKKTPPESKSENSRKMTWTKSTTS